MQRCAVGAKSASTAIPCAMQERPPLIRCDQQRGTAFVSVYLLPRRSTVKSSTTRWCVSPAAWPIIAFAVLAESASNALKAYGLGTHLAAFTVPLWSVEVSLAGAALVCAAVAMSMSQARCFWAAFDTDAPRTLRLLATLIGLLCLAVSVTAIASHILEAQRVKVGAETQDNTAYSDAKALYDAAAADFQRVKDSPSLAEVEAQRDDAIKKAGIDANIWRRSSSCTDVTTKASQNECSKMPVFAKQIAAAKAKATLLVDLPRLKADVDKHRLTGASTSQEANAIWAWAWGLGVAIVIVATFGPVIFRSRVVSAPGKTPEIPVFAANDLGLPAIIPGIPPPTPPFGGGRRGRRADERVVQFSEEFRKRNGRPPAGSEVRAAFPELPVSTAYDYASRARQNA